MTRRSIIVTSLAAVALASCQCNSLRIEGDVSNLPDGPIYLSVLDTTLHWTRVDTANVNNGHFTFRGVGLDDEECLILTSGSQNMVVFAGNSDITLKGNALRPEEIKVSGSDINDKLIEFTESVPGRMRLSQIVAQLSTTTNNVDKQEELSKEAQEIKKAQLDYIRQSILDNASSALGPFLLLNHIGLFSFDEAQAFSDAFKKTPVGGHKYVRLIDSELSKHLQQYEASKRTEIGQPAPEINLADAKGDTTTLRSLRGTVTLITFWKAEDDACRKSNHTIVETFNKFADKGLSVVFISTDNDPREWAAAVAEQGLKGIQLIDQDAQAAHAYDVKAVPASFLIDEDGIIVSKDVEGDNIFADIEARMRKHLQEKK